MQIEHLCCSEMCKCGFTRGEHESLESDESDTVDSIAQGEWTVDTHTKLERTDAFGEIQFAGSTRKPTKV